MPVEITIPRLGWNMDEGRFIAWLKHDGDTIRPGEALFSLESEKSVEEVESLDAGVLRIPDDGPKEGDVIKVGTVIGWLVPAGEEAPPPTSAARSLQTASPPPLAPAAVERSSPVRPVSEHEHAITPRARRAAKELGVDCKSLTGTGRNGRIRERDVRAVAAQSADRVIPLSPHRRMIAERLGALVREAVPVTLTTTADATNLVALREQFRASRSADEAAPTYTDIIVKLAACALARHPMLNARWEGEHIAASAGIHIGIAVDTEPGLVVPVVRDVPNLGLRQLAARSRELVERARSRRLAKDEMQGGTFTVSNLGTFGIDAFTPIINPPECAVLGIGAIRREPAVVGEQIVPRDRLTLSLTFDHRIVDGAPAARFLADLRGGIENPAAWLVS